MKIREFIVGDKVWWIPGQSGYGLIAIKCSITKVEDQWRKEHPDGFLEYEIDEPVGHDLQDHDFCLTEAEARIKLYRLYTDAIKYECEYDTLLTLDYVRSNILEFIYSTWIDVPEGEKNIWNSIEKYPVKKHGEEWFNLYDLGIRIKNRYGTPDKDAPSKSEEP